jgi:ABC-type nitrate/sulfonate/bicarbonate transport system ATPase subunit
VFDSPIEAPTTERQFLRLSDGWALASDSQQWILQRRRGKVWRPVSFVGGGKATLMRILGELADFAEGAAKVLAMVAGEQGEKH